MYFPTKIAINRLGGPQKAAKDLGVPLSTVESWLSGVKLRQPPPEVLKALSDRANIRLDSFTRYYQQVAKFKKL